METPDRPFGFERTDTPSLPVLASFPGVVCYSSDFMGLNLQKEFSSSLGHFDRVAVRVSQYGADNRLSRRRMDTSTGYFHKL